MPDENDDLCAQMDRPAPPEGQPAAYTCAHGASNVPGYCHMLSASITGKPQPQTMPDDWAAKHISDGSGVTDQSNLG